MTLAAGAAVDLTVPGSAANLGPGFDSMGLALGVLDTYRAVVSDRPGLRLDLGEDSQGVPTDERHLVVSSMFRALDELGVARPVGLDLVCRNTIRMGRGMGSSAAAIVAGVALADALRRPEAQGTEGGVVPLDLAFVNDLAAALEGHPDNSSASVFGGVTLSHVDDASNGESAVPHVRTTQLHVHSDIVPVVFVPATQLSTSTARAALPRQVPHAHAALNASRAALLVHALAHEPDALLPATRDWLHQEQRRSAYPEAMALLDTLRAEGHAAAVSGAGPSVLVLTPRARVDEVATHADQAWSMLLPGIPTTGVAVVRATLKASLGEHTGARLIDR